jgi:hypothetical protein
MLAVGGIGQQQQTSHTGLDDEGRLVLEQQHNPLGPATDLHNPLSTDSFPLHWQ